MSGDTFVPRRERDKDGDELVHYRRYYVVHWTGRGESVVLERRTGGGRPVAVCKSCGADQNRADAEEIAWALDAGVAESATTDPLRNAVGAFLEAHDAVRAYQGTVPEVRDSLSEQRLIAIDDMRAAFEATLADRATVAEDPLSRPVDAAGADLLAIVQKMMDQGCVLGPIKDERQRLEKEVARTATEARRADRARTLIGGPHYERQRDAADAAAERADQAVTNLINFDDTQAVNQSLTTDKTGGGT